MWMLLLLLTFLLISIAVLKVRKIFRYWKDLSVEYVSPLGCFGFFNENTFRLNSYSQTLQEIYERYPHKRYIGFYNYFQPILLIRDPELVKRICVKDQDAFNVHSEVIPLSLDELWSKNVFAETDVQQRFKMRGSITPFFTSSKLKHSFPVVQSSSKDFVEYLKGEYGSGHHRLELLTLIRRFLGDLSVQKYFGVKCDSLREPNNPVILMIQEAMKIPILYSFRYIGSRICPTILQILGVKVYNDRVNRFFSDLMEKNFILGARNGFNKDDIISSLFKACHSDLENPTELNRESLNQITAQGLLLLFAGYETTVAAITCVTYELTLNRNVQERLYKEIVDTLQNYDGAVSYQSIESMEYLHNVLEETLRLHPPAAVIDRQAVRDYTIEAETPNEKSLTIEKSTTVWILGKAIQKDPEYFLNPKQFDPDRFSSENRTKINPYANIPFGAGPRMCFGYRYALMIVKVFLVHLLLQFELLPTDNTYVENASNTYTLRDHGIWVELNIRSK